MDNNTQDPMNPTPQAPGADAPMPASDPMTPPVGETNPPAPTDPAPGMGDTTPTPPTAPTPPQDMPVTPPAMPANPTSDPMTPPPADGGMTPPMGGATDAPHADEVPADPSAPQTG